MTPKRVEWDPHAAGRMRQRNISKDDALLVLFHGIWQKEPSIPGRDERFSRRGYLGTREARIVYLENAARYYVITVEWTDEKPGEYPDV